ncbi:alkaline phosphatase D family protein [Gammaproteobacteria bacterium]|nr:alkaline phosphatase D family protein [Gammaproteobacteria bacterium]
MNKNLFISIFSLHLVCISFSLSSDELRIGLGSCIHQDEPQPIWNSIKKDNLDGFIFLGDNVYGDSPSLKLNKMARAYTKQKDNFPNWLMEKEILAIWDDHDYGKNDGGSEYKLKKEAQQLFLKFWNIPPDDIRHSREGIYFDTIKEVGNLKIHFIGLDTRYFRSELKVSKSIYKDNTDKNATVLGKSQWEWLTNVLEKDSDLVVMLTSIQLLATEHRFEKWSNFSLERKKLIDLIESLSKQVMVISGDRHRGGIYKYNNIYELTSSSMNRPVKGFETDNLLIGKTHYEENYGIITINTETSIIKLDLKDKKGLMLESVTIPLLSKQ